MFGYIDVNEPSERSPEVRQTPTDKHIQMYEPLNFVETYIHVYTYINAYAK